MLLSGYEGWACARVSRRIAVSVFAISFIFALCAASPARAFNSYSAVINDARSNISGDVTKTRAGLDLSPSVADSCLPLLKSIRHTSSNFATDRNQRPAGAAAPYELVFGIRLAPGPGDINSPYAGNHNDACKSELSELNRK